LYIKYKCHYLTLFVNFLPCNRTTFRTNAPQMTVSATLKGRYKLNMRTVYIRISDGKVRKFTPTKIKIEDKHWDFGKSQAKTSHPNHKIINGLIKDKINAIQTGKVIISKEYFEAYYKKCLFEWANSKKHETLRNLKCRLNKFSEFAGNVKLDQVTPDLLKRYAEHCYKIGNTGNTVWSAFKAVRTIIKKAHLEKLINDYPFDLFEMPKYKDPAKTFLTKEQVDQIENLCRDKKCPDEYKIAGAWFVISCYTGLRFGDQAAFNKKHIRNGRLIIYTSKTGTPVSIPLNDKLKTLFELVNYQPMTISNVHYNRVIKAIAAECGIENKISVHTARHTFGTLCASQGISQEVTAKLMGHSSIKTTAIYYQLTSDRLDSEFEKIF
jgi:site-specific recombinase XerD